MKRSTGLVWIAVVLMAFSVCLCATLEAGMFKSKKSNAQKNDDGDAIDEFDVKDKVPLIGQFTQVVGQSVIELHGAGLVVGLDGTGEDPPPSLAREMVLTDMKRRGVPNPNKLLKSPNVAIVLITAFLPPLIREGEHFDIEVTLPERSKVKSLHGGFLMETYLAEHAIVPGQGDHKGKELATARGPILISGIHGNLASQAGMVRRGRIVAGGKSKIDRDLALYLRNDFRSERNAVRVATAIGRRFFEYDKHGQQIALAEAKTDQQIKLKVLSKYRDNYPRYLDVIRRIAFRETDVARQVRMKRLRWELVSPETAASAALELEGIGEEAVPTLKVGLTGKDPEVRFNSAMALAYLGDPSGVDALADAVRNQYAFRIFALAAMASLEDPEVNVKLRELMDVESAETRYGAFRALTTLDANDPFVHGRKINDQYSLHALHTEGPPMVHLTNCKKTEVVLFGADQELRTPLFARAGTCILVSAPAGSQKVRVSRFAVGQEDQQKDVSTKLEDVILAISDFGATFPDVAQFLVEADSQRNLAGRLEIDALPRAGRFYERNKFAIKDDSAAAKKRVGNSSTAPNLFAIELGKSSSQADDSDDGEHGAAGDAAEQAGHKKHFYTKADGEDLSSVKATSASSTNASSAVSASSTVTADQKTNDPSKAANGSGANPAGVTPDGKPAAAKPVEPIDQPDTPATPPPSRFSFWRFFGFGSDTVSGNKEP